ncbi:MAG: Crp/Fnr family transcriptional regulator [Lachnospiraceae bacterium]|nr:Crp/Fnr family transcriptional regulator [Lachnospiraceae bacterium]
MYQNYLAAIKKSPLFSGVTEKEMEAMLGCLSVTTSSYEKNQFIFRFGEEINSMGMVLTGCVHILQEDFWGNRNILSEVGPGELFGEVYACMPGAVLNVNALASEPAVILFLDVRHVLTTCSSSCEFHTRLIRNLMSVLAGKNLKMNEKLTHMAQRTTREKLLSYLSSQAVRKGSSSFDIPFNRQQLADYLSVDRSAMSNELGKMQAEGLLLFERNHFVLK